MSHEDAGQRCLQLCHRDEAVEVCWVASIEIKICYGIIEGGPIETTFLDRVARNSRRALQ